MGYLAWNKREKKKYNGQLCSLVRLTRYWKQINNSSGHMNASAARTVVVDNFISTNLSKSNNIAGFMSKTIINNKPKGFLSVGRKVYVCEYTCTPAVARHREPKPLKTSQRVSA